MIPSIDDRLDSIVRALQEVILPALDPHQSLAIEQAQLALAHIAIIRQQLDKAPEFELDEAKTLLTLSDDLLATAEGGDSTQSAATTLRTVVERAVLDSPLAIRNAIHDIGAAIEVLIHASLEDGTEAFCATSSDQVLSSGRRAALANRRWNLASGFEAPDAGITAIDAT